MSTNQSVCSLSASLSEEHKQLTVKSTYYDHTEDRVVGLEKGDYSAACCSIIPGILYHRYCVPQVAATQQALLAAVPFSIFSRAIYYYCSAML